MNNYEFCFAWNWPYDSDFVSILTHVCQHQGVSLLQVTPSNLDATLNSLYADKLSFQVYLDRASDADESFHSLAGWADRQAWVYLNQLSQARRAWDKGRMHERLLQAGLSVPHTLILPPYCDQPDLPPPPELEHLGGCFVIKPAHGGGGCGVVVGANSWEQVLYARQEFPTDQYLVQEHVHPLQIEGRPAWFRVIYCTGQVFPCWWDPCTHIYTPMTPAEHSNLNMRPLIALTHSMADICNLDLFSSEIACSPAGEFVVVDYVNDPLDLRPQSKTPEGVPDELLEGIARSLACFAASTCQEAQLLGALAYRV